MLTRKPGLFFPVAFARYTQPRVLDAAAHSGYHEAPKVITKLRGLPIFCPGSERMRSSRSEGKRLQPSTHHAIKNVTITPELPRYIKEVEAESVAFILCSILELPGQPESRGYIQNWLAGQEIPEANAKRIFGAADRILKAGQA